MSVRMSVRMRAMSRAEVDVGSARKGCLDVNVAMSRQVRVELKNELDKVGKSENTRREMRYYIRSTRPHWSARERIPSHQQVHEGVRNGVRNGMGDAEWGWEDGVWARPCGKVVWPFATFHGAWSMVISLWCACFLLSSPSLQLCAQ
jgi:hypothetical protein